MSSAVSYRDKIYIRKDILLKLIQYRSLNQTALLSFCGLNLQKHKQILVEMEERGLLAKREIYRGKKKITLYEVTGDGVQFCRKILEPYEEMFPRIKRK
jgi:predicted transcriptional regulator